MKKLNFARVFILYPIRLQKFWMDFLQELYFGT